MARYIFEQMKEHLPEEFKPNDLNIDVDSTSHVQHGEKNGGTCMELQKRMVLGFSSFF